MKIEGETPNKQQNTPQLPRPANRSSPYNSHDSGEKSQSPPTLKFDFSAKGLNQFSLYDTSTQEFSFLEQISKEVYRTTRSCSPSSRSIIYDYYYDQGQIKPSTIQREDEKSKSLKSLTPLYGRYPQTSKQQTQEQECRELVVSSFVLVPQTYVPPSPRETNDIKSIMFEKKEGSKVNYFSIIIKDMNDLVDKFISSSQENIFCIENCKEIIVKFDKLRGDYINKLRANQKSQILTPDQMNTLSLIFGQIRFILTRFGRIINFFDAMEQTYKRRKIVREASVKQSPYIQKIQQLESSSNSEYEAPTHRPSLSSTRSDAGQAKYPFKNSLSCDKKNSVEQYRDLLATLTDKEKSQIIERYMRALAKRWAEQYEDERKRTVPLVICRICNQQFYADKEDQHSKYCMQKIQTSKEQAHINQKFLELSHKVTECIIHVSKVNAANTPRLGSTPKFNLLNTPTLKRRTLMQGQDNASSGSQLQASVSTLVTAPQQKDIQSKSQEKSASAVNDKSPLKTTVTNAQKKSTFFNNPNNILSERSEADNGEDNSKFQKEEQSLKVPSYVPKLQLNKLSEKAELEKAPQNKLLMYTTKGDQAGPSQQTSTTMQGRQGQNLTKVSSTLNTLRGLELNKGLKSFETKQGSGTNLGVTQPPQQKQSLEPSAQLVEEKEETKEQDNSAQEAEKAKVQAKQLSALKKLSSFNEKKEEDKKTNLNYLTTFASIRKDKQKDEKGTFLKPAAEVPQSARAPNNTLGFFKNQKLEEKKTIDTKNPLVKRVSNPVPNLEQVILPKSPYLQNMTRKFENITSILQQIQDQEETQEHQKQKSLLSTPKINSPYIGLSNKFLTQEQKQEHLKRLKDHVQLQINKGVQEVNPKKDIKNAPLSNAFSINIKNEREEVAKQMDNLRKSVKLQKRANPLEKLMSKMIKHEQEGSQGTPKQASRTNELQKTSQKTPQLQEIAESIEEEHQSAKTELRKKEESKLVPSSTQPNKINQKLKSGLGELSKPFAFGGMSPIISFRPLNNVSDKSRNGTPKSITQANNRGSKTQRDKDSDLSYEEVQKSQEMLQALQSAKKEIDILENLKQLAVESFNLSIYQKSFKQQKGILEQYLNQLQMMADQNQLTQKSQEILDNFENTLIEKIQALQKLEELDRNYDKTLPIEVVKQKREEDKLQEAKMKRFITQSTQREPNSRKSDKNQATSQSMMFSSPKKDLVQPSSSVTETSSNESNQIKRMQSQEVLLNFMQGKIIPTRNIFDTSYSPSSIPSDSFSDNHTSLSSISQKHTTPLIGSRGLIQNKKGEGQKVVIPPSLLSLSKLGSPQVDKALPQVNQIISGEGINKKGSFHSNNTLDSIQEEEVKESVKWQSHLQGPKTRGQKSQFNTQSSQIPPFTKQGSLGLESSAHSSSSQSVSGERTTNCNVDEEVNQSTIKSQTKVSPRDLFDQSSNDMMPKQTDPKTRNVLKDMFKTGTLSKSFPKLKSVNRLGKENSPLRNSSPNSSTKHMDDIECQSDIVVGMNYDQEIEEDQREANSDFHDLLFINELFQDQNKFDDFIDNVHRFDNFAQSLSKSPFSDQSQPQSDEDDEVLTMGKVRFNSLTILPSQVEQCSLENTKSHHDITINDFILIKTISRGAYGKVILARKKMTKDIFAIKVLDKEKMLEKNVIEYVMNERDILSTVNNEFIVRGAYTFQSKQYLYMVMEFMKGGDFSNLLENIGFLDQDTAKLYLAQVVLALEYLHSKGIIHRDLKPDNLLIDSDGHIKLTDFGLSEAGLKNVREHVKNMSQLRSPGTEERHLQIDKEIQSMLGCEQIELRRQIEERKKESQNQANINKKGAEKTQKTKGSNEEVKPQKHKRILGTADYMAPEVIKGEEHSYQVDFWSLGVIAYEFLTGVPPFNADTPDQVFKKILQRDMKWPNIGTEEGEISPEAYDFMSCLLDLDSTKRLGVNGIQKIKNHPFFHGIQWDKIMEEPVPFIPGGRDLDTEYFPKANEHDEELKLIVEDKKHAIQEIRQDFNKFGGVVYETLQSINQKEAKKAMARVKRQRAKEQASAVHQETILKDL